MLDKRLDPIILIKAALREAVLQEGELIAQVAGRPKKMKLSGVSSHILTNVASRLSGQKSNPTHKRQSSTDAVFEASDADSITYHGRR